MSTDPADAAATQAPARTPCWSVIPWNPRPRTLDRQQFEALWSGSLMLVAVRLRLDSPDRPFDLLW
jgi:hypothetical protein